MAKISTRAGIGIVIALAVIALLMAFLVPVGINSIEGTDSTSLNMTEGQTYTVQQPLNATLDNTTDTTVDLTLTDTESGDTQTITGLSEGTNTTVTLNGENITVENTDSYSGYAIVKFEYPQDYGWSDSAKALWGILPIIIILVAILFILGMGLKATGTI